MPLPDVEQYPHDFFELSLDNVCVAGLDGYFKRVNPSWTKTLGWTAEELLSRPSVEFVHPDDQEAVLEGRQRMGAGGALGPLINRYRCKDGTYRWLEWRSVAQVDQGLVYAVARDVTEQKLAEERLGEAKTAQENLQRQLIFADRMASVGTLAAGVAHEVNNPLACVSANIEMIIEELRSVSAGSAGSERDEQLRNLGEMALDVQLAAERIRTIVRGLKTFSRGEEEQTTVIDVQPSLELSINMTFHAIRHRARLVKDYGKMPLVEADEARLGQVFVSLLINAAEAIPEGNAAGNEIRITTSSDAAGRAVIEVRDTGLGIPQNVLDRIFDPFFTTKPVGIGTGLGLSICHNILTAMGGAITVASEEGRGTTFRVALPAAPGVPDEAAAAASTSPAKSAKVCAAVLVVDDEVAVASVLRRVLRDHEVTAVASAKQALELIEAGTHFDVILCDVMMPDMSGMDLYDELLLRFPDAARRVVFVSGGAFTPSVRAFFDRVSSERVEKPFDVETVRNIVQRFVG